MAGILLGNIAGAIVDFIRMIKNTIIEGLKWLKQAIIVSLHAIEKGLTQAVSYEKTIAREAIRGILRNEELTYGILFALVFDFLGVNG